MSERLLLSRVPRVFKSSITDEIRFGYQVQWVCEDLMAKGLRPHSALDVFYSVRDKVPVERVVEARCYLILGEVVSSRIMSLWRKALEKYSLGVVVKETALACRNIAKDKEQYLVWEYGEDNPSKLQRPAFVIPDTLKRLDARLMQEKYEKEDVL